MFVVRFSMLNDILNISTLELDYQFQKRRPLINHKKLNQKLKIWMYKKVGGERWKTVLQTEQWLLLEMYNNVNTVKPGKLLTSMLMHINSTTPWNKGKIDKWPRMSNAKSANIKFSQLMWKQIANLFEINVPFEMTKYLVILLFENSKCRICL